MNTKSLLWFLGCVLIVFLGAFYIQSWKMTNQQSAAVTTQPACGPLSFTLDPISNTGGTVVRGQQDRVMLALNITNGNCAAKITSIGFKNIGTAVAADIERAIVNVPYYAPTNFTTTQTVMPMAGTNVTFVSNQTPLLIPANAGAPGSGLPAYQIQFWASVANTAVVGHTLQFQVDPGSIIAKTQTTSAPMNTTGAFPFTSGPYYFSASASNISTDAATNLTSSSAKLNSTLFAPYFGGNGTVKFYYSTNGTIPSIYANQTPSVTLTSSMTNVNKTITGLVSSTNYYYRVCGVSNSFTVCGAIQSFKTKTPPTGPNDVKNN